MDDKIKLKGQLNKFIKWPIYMSLLLIALNIGVYFVDLKSGLIVSLGVFVYILACIALNTYHKPGILRDFLNFANQYDLFQKKLIEDFALPYALMDMNGKMIWSNKTFSELTGKDQFYKKSVTSIFSEITVDKLPKKDKAEITEYSIDFAEKKYRISLQRVLFDEVFQKSEVLMTTSQDSSLIAMYLYDETELKEYIQKNEDNKLVVALAYLDNYEEALESVEDVRRSLLIALIDRKITKYFSNYDGLVRKLEKDKYFLIMRQSSLEVLKEQKFQILILKCTITGNRQI